MSVCSTQLPVVPSCSSNIWLFFREVMITIRRGQALNPLRTFCTLPLTYTLNMFTPASHGKTGWPNWFVSPKLVYSRISTRQRGPCLISPHFFYAWTLAVDTFFYIETQKRSRVTKLGAQTQHRVVLRLVPPSASEQSEIMCARDKCVVFHNIGKAISGSTVRA